MKGREGKGKRRAKEKDLRKAAFPSEVSLHHLQSVQSLPP